MADPEFSAADIQKLLLDERDGRLPKDLVAGLKTLRADKAFPPAIPRSEGLETGQLAAKSLPGGLGGAMGVLLTPGGGQAARDVAATTLPLAAAVATGGASLPVQAGAQMATTAAMQGAGLEEPSAAQIGISGALPFAGAVAGRVARGVERTATRLIPSRFRAAQNTAQEAAGEVVDQLRPETAAGNLFKGARAAGGDAIPTRNIQLAVKDLNDTIGPSPSNAGLKLVREHLGKLEEASSTGSVDLNRIMQLRLDMGRDLKKAPELGALYGSVIRDLQVASKSGGPGATNALEALKAYKADLGANKMTTLVEKATTDSVAGGTRALNVATLRKEVSKNHDELVKLLGPEKFQTILAFTERFKGLPPAQAYTAMNLLGNVIGGGVLTFTGGPLVALGGAAGLELMKNAALVGKNPKALNATLTALTEMSRAGVVQATRDEP